jgi:PAS domain S-box-containing protein
MKQRSGLFKKLRNISITKKLYFIVGIMALLIAIELFTLWFAVNTLSSVRAYVAGEGLYSKAQKDAVYHLRVYVRTRDEKDYQNFLKFMKIPQGDNKARMALEKPEPDLDIATQGFLEGRNHPDDIPGMISLFRRFHRIYYIDKAIRIWREADPIIGQLIPIGDELHEEVMKRDASKEKIDVMLNRMDPIIERISVLEDDFSFTLGEGSRWLEHLILRLLFAVALTVELSGLLLAFSVSRNITKGLNEINRAAEKITRGSLGERAKIFSKDEIGVAASNVNLMTEQLEQNIKALEHSFSILEATIESTADGILVVDLNGRILRHNKKFVSLWRIPEHLLATGDDEKAMSFVMNQLADPEAFVEKIKDLYSKPVAESFDLLKFKDGRTYERYSKPQMINGECIGRVWSFRDITERTITKQKITHTETLLSEAQQLAKVGDWNYDIVKNDFTWSEGTRATYGVDTAMKPSFEEFMAMIYPEDRERVLDKFFIAQQSGNSVDDEFRIIRTDGEIRVLKTQTKFVQDGEGNPMQVIGISQDITELKLAVETHRRSEANLNTMLDNGDTSYILLDQQLNIISLNRHAKRFAKEELHTSLSEGKNIVTGARNKEPFRKETLLGALKGKSITSELKLANNHGAERWYDVRYFPVLNNEKKSVLGLIIALQEITERKETEKETLKLVDKLQARNKDLKQFAYMVSHNLRAPIAKISGLITMYMHNPEDQATNTSLIQYLENEIDNLDKVVKDMNSVVTISDSDHEIKEFVYFEIELRLILNLLESEVKESNASITWNFRDIAGVVTIKSYLYSILYNLISNAIKYRDPSRQLIIHIQATQNDSLYCLSVQDNGLGIDLKKHGDKLFGLYKRFHGNGIPGRGIGLSMVKVQAESLGGKIEVESGLSAGTIFKIYLPHTSTYGSN